MKYEFKTTSSDLYENREECIEETYLNIKNEIVPEVIIPSGNNWEFVSSCCNNTRIFYVWRREIK